MSENYPRPLKVDAVDCRFIHFDIEVFPRQPKSVFEILNMLFIGLSKGLPPLDFAYLEKALDDVIRYLAHPLASLTVGVVWRVDEAIGDYVASISSVDPVQKIGINVNFRIAPAPELHIHELVAMDRPALAFVLDPFAHWVASIRFALNLSPDNPGTKKRAV
jgi:hypothetical protein